MFVSTMVPSAPPPDFEAALSDACAAVARLAAADVSGVGEDQLRRAVVALGVAANQLAGAAAAVTAAFDATKGWAADGAKTLQAWLRHHCRCSPEAAGRQVRHARRLRDLPATDAALRAGEITSAHVQRLAAADNPRTRDALRRDEAMLVGWARTERFDRFCARLAAWVDGNDPDGAFRDRPDRRRLHLSKTFQDGWALDGWLDPISGTIVAAELDRLEHELFDDDRHEARDLLGRDPGHDEVRRTPAQRRADALVEMARRSAATAPGAPRGRLLVTVVTGPDRFHHLCELLDGTPISPHEVVAHLDHHTTIERIVFDDDAQPIAASKQRTFTGVLRRAIQIRDRECTHPLCDEPAHRCQIDHIQPWSQGGPTTLTNGRLTCGHHNRARNHPPPPDGWTRRS